MNVNLTSHPATDGLSNHTATPKPPDANRLPSVGDDEARETFDRFVGQTVFGQLLKSMRKTVGKSAYFHGGRAEEIFQQQLDEVVAEKLSDASTASFSGPMYELFALGMARK